MNKHMRQLLRKMEARGWRWSLTNGGHYRLEKDGAVVIGPQTPSDRRSWLNFRAQIRRAERAADRDGQ